MGAESDGQQLSDGLGPLGIGSARRGNGLTAGGGGLKPEEEGSTARLSDVGLPRRDDVAFGRSELGRAWPEAPAGEEEGSTSAGRAGGLKRNPEGYFEPGRMPPFEPLPTSLSIPAH